VTGCIVFAVDVWPVLTLWLYRVVLDGFVFFHDCMI
jgi:hypothetical protein